MIELKKNNKGIALLIVLTTVLLVVILANIVLTVILSHSRLTRHQLNRTQAYYATQAGMNYALEQLRIGRAAGGWESQPNNNCPAPNGCPLPPDPQLPASVQSVNIILWPPGPGAPPTCNPDFTCIQIVTQYRRTE